MVAPLRFRPSSLLSNSAFSRTSRLSPSRHQRLLARFRAISHTANRRAASHSEGHHDDHSHAEHESHFDPPGGWLWGVPPGTKREKEGWENVFYWGFCGSIGLAVVAYAFKPDTSIETWALEEAKRRLQAEGTLPEDE